MPLRLSIASIFFATAVLTAADNWPEFRGPKGNGISDAKGISTSWSETENVRWKVPIHDKGWSSPVVWKDQVWLTTAKEKGTEFFAICLDRKTGKTIYDLQLFSAEKPTDISSFNSYASCTPAIEEGRVYAHFGSFGTACLDTATGKVLWERKDLPCNHFRGPASSPVLYQDKLFLVFDGFDLQYVACLDKITGKTLWKKDRTLPYKDTGKPMLDGDLKKAYATPTVIEIDGKARLISPAAMGTVALDVESGEELWRVIHGGMNEASRPLFAHGLLYVTAGHTSTLVAVKATGTGDVTKSGIEWKAEKISPSRSSPLIVGDLLFMVSDAGFATCVDAKTGKQIWHERLNDKFSASPVYADGMIYVPGETGKTYVIAAERTFRIVEENKLEAGCRASPAIAGDAIYLRTLTHMYCIGKK